MSMKKLPIEELDFKTDEEAIRFIQKLKATGKSLYYVTDGEKERYFLGKIDDVPLFESMVKTKIELLENKVKELEQKMSKLNLDSKPPLQASVPNPIEKVKGLPAPAITNLPENIVSKTPKGLTLLPRSEQKPNIKIDTESLHFVCPKCGHEFDVQVEKGKKIMKLTCPNCGEAIFQKGLSKKKIVGIVAGAVATAFILLLLFV